jgi:hypothetical protein
VSTTSTKQDQKDSEAKPVDFEALQKADEKAQKAYDGPNVTTDALPDSQPIETPLGAALADTAQVPVGEGDGAPVIGSYVTVDRDKAKDAYKNLPSVAGTYGVFHSLREDVAEVQLRDETHQFIYVPVEALRAASPHGR